jgi:hypothetical protein
MEPDEIEVFLILAEELHFTRTAERFYLPQPRVSRLIASLAQHGGCRREQSRLEEAASGEEGQAVQAGDNGQQPAVAHDQRQVLEDAADHGA